MFVKFYQKPKHQSLQVEKEKASINEKSGFQMIK